NWARTFRWQPSRTYVPETDADVANLVRDARRARAVVRVVGARHSPSDIAATPDADAMLGRPGFAVRMHRMANIVHIDRARLTVTAQAGITLEALSVALDRAGLALENLGSIAEQTVAGSMATGTHGAGSRFGVLSSTALEIVLITGTGERRVLRRDDPDPDAFRAALCSLGCLGIVVQVTLRVVPAFQLAVVEGELDFATMAQQLPSLLAQSDHTRLWWMPPTDRVLAQYARRITPPAADASLPPPPTRPRPGWVRGSLIPHHLYEASLYAATWMPRLLAPLDPYAAIAHADAHSIPRGRSFEMFKLDCLFKQYVTEWCVPLADAARVLTALRDAIRAAGPAVAGAVHAPIEIRSVAADDALLSPATASSTPAATAAPFVYIGIITYRPYGADAPGRARYWALYEAILRQRGGRPHWAKAFPLGPAELARLYPETWATFQRVRASCDPDNVFTNAYVRRHL
ncbi:hypothetical protein CXG81DRAFT_5912, partial [Caulochytrium protostelioides]